MHKHDNNHCSKHNEDHNHNDHSSSHKEVCPIHGKVHMNETQGTNNVSEHTAHVDGNANDQETSLDDDDPEGRLKKHDHQHEHNHSAVDEKHHRCHSTGGWEKPNNIFLKWIWYFCLSLGLVSNDDNHSTHIGHSNHIHTFDIKNWIMITSTIIGVFALIAMITSLFVNHDSSYYEFVRNDWLELTLGTISFIIMGLAFVKGSYVTIKAKTIAEDTLVALATTSAYLYSVFAFIFNQFTETNLPYFFYEAIEVLWLIYLGRFVENKLMAKITKDMLSLETLKPKLALVIRDEEEIEVNVNELKLDDLVIVKPGSVIPIDGIVVEGETTVDESTLTGESLPISKKVDSKVFGGTVSSNGLITVKVTKLIGDSFITKIINSAYKAVETKPDTQRIADKIAGWLVPLVLVIALITFLLTGIITMSIGTIPGQFDNLIISSGFNSTQAAWMYAFYIVITILVIACPCSFALQTPMAVLVSSSNAKKNGIIFSSKTVFEDMKDINLIAFDKTGTLTEGKFKVTSSTIPDKYLSNLVSIEKNSNHPLAQSIVEFYKDIKTNKIKVNEIVGKGMEHNDLKVGSLKWVKEFHNEFKESKEVLEKRNKGSAIIYLFNSKEVIGYVALKDEIKESSRLALANIRNMGIDVVMITGDNKQTALSIAQELGIKEKNVYSEVDPTQKSTIIKELQDKGNKVAFVGDGINDSVALIQSDLGIAIGEGSDAAIEASDIVLNENDISLVTYAIWLSNRTVSTIKRGFAIAVGYNMITIPIAATGILGLTGFGPALASMIMILNDSMAMLNALTLKKESKRKFNKKNNK